MHITHAFMHHGLKQVKIQLQRLLHYNTGGSCHRLQLVHSAISH